MSVKEFGLSLERVHLSHPQQLHLWASHVRSPTGIASLKRLVATLTDAGRTSGGPLLRALAQFPSDLVDTGIGAAIRSGDKLIELGAAAPAGIMLSRCERLVIDRATSEEPDAEQVFGAWMDIALRPVPGHERPGSLIEVGVSLQRSAMASASIRVLTANLGFPERLHVEDGDDVRVQWLGNPAQLSFISRRIRADSDSMLVEASAGKAAFFLVGHGRSEGILRVDTPLSLTQTQDQVTALPMDLLGIKSDADRIAIWNWAHAGNISINPECPRDTTTAPTTPWGPGDLANALAGVHVLRQMELSESSISEPPVTSKAQRPQPGTPGMSF